VCEQPEVKPSSGASFPGPASQAWPPKGGWGPFTELGSAT
jgi:hypothetical protein